MDSTNPHQDKCILFSFKIKTQKNQENQNPAGTNKELHPRNPKSNQLRISKEDSILKEQEQEEFQEEKGHEVGIGSRNLRELKKKYESEF